jgi:hypothetical protein
MAIALLIILAGALRDPNERVFVQSGRLASECYCV